MSGVTPFTISRFGSTWNMIRFDSVSTAPWPYISESAYAVSIGVVTGIALLIGIARTALRFHQQGGRFDVHDAVFSFALCCTLASAVLIIYAGPLFYIETELQAGAVFFTNASQLTSAAIQYLKIIYGVQDVQWLSIYSVKLCYLLFFHKLTNRLKKMRIWWWVISCFTVIVFVITMCLPAAVCMTLDDSIFTACPINDMNYRAAAGNKISAALDIVSDVLIISIPIMLLSKTKIDLRRKLTIGVILSLSCVMIAIALVRILPPKNDPMVDDAAWYFFWIAFESAIAVIMVSITAFRSIFQSEAPSHKAHSDSWTSKKFGSEIAKFFSAVKLLSKKSRRESTDPLQHDSEKSPGRSSLSGETFYIDQSFGIHSGDFGKSFAPNVGNSTQITSNRSAEWV